MLCFGAALLSIGWLRQLPDGRAAVRRGRPVGFVPPGSRAFPLRPVTAVCHVPAFRPDSGANLNISAGNGDCLSVDQSVGELSAGMLIHSRHSGSGNAHLCRALILRKLLIIQQTDNLIFVIADIHRFPALPPVRLKTGGFRQGTNAAAFRRSCQVEHLLFGQSIARLWEYVNN